MKTWFSACLTSFVILAVGAEGLHGDVASRPTPPGLADAVPTVLVQGTATVVVTQAWAALCSRPEHGELIHTHTHRRVMCVCGRGECVWLRVCVCVGVHA